MRSILTCALAFAASCAAALGEHQAAAASDAAFAYYATSVKTRPTGAYEWSDYVFAHVRIPFEEGKSNRKKARMQAVLTANDLLRNWAIDKTAAFRPVQADLPHGVAIARDIVLKHLPKWSFRDWRVEVDSREYPAEAEDGFFTFGLIFDRAALERSIPDSFRQAPPERDWCAGLPHIVPGLLLSDRRDVFLASCGAWDLASAQTRDSSDGQALADFRNFQFALDTYLADSALAGEMRRRCETVAGPRETTGFSAKPHPTESDTKVEVSVVTNWLESVAVVSNSLKRTQTAAEIAGMGRSHGGLVTDDGRESDVAVIVATVTKTVVETTMYDLHKSEHSVSGEPVFERMFLACGTNGCVEAAQTETGRRAAETFRAKTGRAEKERALVDALGENPGDKELWNLYGRCLAARNELTGAVVCFRVALKLDETYEYALANLAEAYDALGYRALATGTAVVARGCAKSDWCVKHSEAILLKD